MKIADYGKAITSYIESPTKDQKDKLKLQAGLLEEYLGDDLEYQKAVDDGFQGTKEDYYRYKFTSEEDRTFLADGTPPPKKPRQLKDLFKKIDTAVLAVSSNTVPPEFILPNLESLTQKYISDGLISGEDARKFALERKDYYDNFISKNAGETVPAFDFDNEGKAIELSQEEIIKRINQADGGRVGFKKGSDPISSLSFAQIRKLFPTYFDAAATTTQVDEKTIKKILQMYANKEGGRTYIGNQLGLDQSVVGRILKRAEANKLITKVDPKDFKTKASQRIYESPRARKIHNIVRPITELDRKQNPNIPKNARFKIVFATPQGKTTKIPDEFIGVKYFDTEKAANVALDKRLKADFSKPEDPTAAKFKAQKKRTDFLRRNAPLYASGTGNYEFHHIMNIGGEIPLDTNDIAVISKKMNRILSPYNKDLNRIGDSISTLINEQPDGYLKRIDELNDVGEKIVKKAIKELPKEYRNLIGFNRVVPVLDEYGTPVSFVGKKFGGSNQKQPGIKLEKLTTEQAINLKNQIKTDAVTLGKSTIKDKILSSTGKVLKTAGKIIKPVGYAIGIGSAFQAKSIADEMGIDLKPQDYAAAMEMGDPQMAINMWKMRNDPEFAAEEKAKTLAIPLDEGTYDAIDNQSTFGKYNDQIKNIKLP